MPPSYFSRLSVAFQRGTLVVEQEGGPQQSVKALIGQGKLLFGNSRLLHAGSSKFGKLHVSSQPEIDAASKFNLHLVNQRRNLSVIGVPTPTFSTIYVSGTSFQVCGCHLETGIFPLGVSQKMPMAVSGMRAVVGDYTLSKLTSRHGHLTFSTNNAAICHGNRAYDGCRKVNMNLRSKERPNNYFLYGYFTLDVTRRTNNFVPDMVFRSMGLHSSTSACVSAGTAPDESFGNSALDEKHTSSVVSSEQKITAERTLKLLSGSCYLPHPDKEETGGEDAHFICDEQAIGVADGVGGWADLGINAGLYARELMSNSVTAIQEELKGLIDPARVLEKAHLRTKAKGSSTACIVALTNEGLHAINLGDSGFVVVRDGCTIFRSPVQQHDFNFTYQLESGNDGDLPSSGQVFTIPVASGDVMIAGTDGLFDNLYNNEVTAVVVHAMRAGLGPQVTAQKIAALARERAQDKNRQTPFSSAAQDAGFRYYGGKLDDITVVVSYITSVTDEKSSSSQGSR